MNKRVVLLTKDAMCKSYLPVYNVKSRWKGFTPNLDELAAKGTVFTNCYTAAPSTAMAFLGIFTGKYPYELDIHDYTPMREEYKDNLFRKFEAQGYRCHIIWDSKWDSLAKPYANCYGNATFHSLDALGQPVGARFPHEGILVRDEDKVSEVIERLQAEIEQIIEEEQLFLWIHLPHVINGRISYGDDIDAYDAIIGMLRGYFPDNAIYLSADHGNMAGTHGKVGYGFDLYYSAIAVPLIIPRISGYEKYNEVFSTIDLGTLLTEERIIKRDVIYVDTAYYKQPHRKLAVIHNNYHYIYNKQSGREEIYDIDYDPGEGINLFGEKAYDKDRKRSVPIRDLLPYNKWEQLENEKRYLVEAKNAIWRSESLPERLYWSTRHFAGACLGRAELYYINIKHGIKQLRNKL